jgi:hypothetical protein
MRYRIAFISGLAAGFVVGTRAGRERYEQLKRLARTAADNPAVQQAAGALQAQATGLAKTAGQKVTDQVREKVPGLPKPPARPGRTRQQRDGNGAVGAHTEQALGKTGKSRRKTS